MVHRKSGPGPCGGGTLILTRFAVQGSRSLGLAASVIGLTFLSSFPSPLPAMTLRRLRLTLPAAMLLAGLHGQTPPSPAPDAAPVAPVAPDTSLAVPAPVAPAEAPPTPPVAPVASAPSSATPARTLTKEEALKEIDAGLAAFDLTARAERSPVIHAAMMTRLTLLRQRRADLAKAFSPGRFRALHHVRLIPGRGPCRRHSSARSTFRRRPSAHSRRAASSWQVVRAWSAQKRRGQSRPPCLPRRS